VRRLALAFGLLALGCTGAVENRPGQGAGPATGPAVGRPSDPPSGTPAPSDNPAGNPPAAPPSAQVACSGTGQDTVGRRVLRRLTKPELETTIRAAFGLDATQWSGLAVPPDPGSADGFNNHVDQLTVGAEYVRGLEESGRKLAALVSAKPHLEKLLPCAAAPGPACAATFLDTVGPRLYRRPLTPAEKTRYLALHDKAQTGGQPDFGAFVYWATATMLQSPNVIYRSELGQPDRPGVFRLTSHEVASALSYTFTGGPPGPELLELAAANRLSSADEAEAAARTLIFEAPGKVRPAFAQVLLRFADQWLGLDNLSNLKKDDQAFPDFTSQIQDALAEETGRFLTTVLLDQGGTLASLLTAPFTFVDSRLTKYYGFGGSPAAGSGFVRVDRPADWGVGLLAQGSMLAIESHSLSTSPTKRGILVRTRLLCGVVPPPPPVVSPLPEPTEADTTRQRYEVLHLADNSCKTCHQMIDPIGFGFEHLDASGRYRAREGAFEIDDRGVVSGTSAGDLTFRGPTELAAAIARLPETNDCLASYVAAYAFGVSQENASCLVRSATAGLRSGGSVLDFFVRLARLDHFRMRQP
jgi:hypothetical protein